MIPSLREQTVIVVKAPAETILEVPHPEEVGGWITCSTPCTSCEFSSTPLQH